MDIVSKFQVPSLDDLGKPYGEKVCFCLYFFQRGGGGSFPDPNFLKNFLFVHVWKLTFYNNIIKKKYSQWQTPPLSLREVIRKKKLLTFGHCAKRGGVNQNQKVLGFFGPSFGHYGGKGG